LNCELPTERVEVQADPVQLAAAFTALGKNAVEAAAEGGRVSLALHARQDEALLEVRDNGPGISPEQRRHIFEPYYSARQAGRGLGLGLPKAWRIAQLHGGEIRVQSRPGEETVFILRLPRRRTSGNER
ncbi:MAG: two-component sensor histidine kinase, partial [Thermogutta sp.]|nr:two-component sensor histidine kinase [Thermogutta sp.]